MAVVHEAAKEHFLQLNATFDQPDVINMQWQFFRLLFPSKAAAALPKAAILQALQG